AVVAAPSVEYAVASTLPSAVTYHCSLICCTPSVRTLVTSTLVSLPEHACQLPATSRLRNRGAGDRKIEAWDHLYQQRSDQGVARGDRQRFGGVAAGQSAAVGGHVPSPEGVYGREDLDLLQVDATIRAREIVPRCHDASLPAAPRCAGKGRAPRRS